MVSLLVACSKPVKVQYLNAPELVPYDGFSFKLNAPFLAVVNRQVFVVPRGFITDLASVPRFLWPLYPPQDTRTIRPAILHDYMYQQYTGLSRIQADRIFYYGLLENGLSKSKSLKYYYGVRMVGWLFYTTSRGRHKDDE
ncbi:MAG: DUF1353 domain-containing protein [Phycisphaerae bacterium]